MTTEQIAQIALLFQANPTLKPEDVEIGLIFGEYAENEHILRGQIAEIKAKTLELIGYVEPVVETPVVEETPQSTMEEVIADALGIELPTADPAI